MEVRIAEVDSDLELVGSLLIQLRPSYDLRTIIAQIKDQQKRGYTVAYIGDDGQAICAAGFVIETRLAWGKHMYIEDIVTDTNRRSSGLGKIMLDGLNPMLKKMTASRFIWIQAFKIFLHIDSICARGLISQVIIFRL